MRGAPTISEALAVRPAIPSLSFSYRYPMACLCGGTGSDPVRRASRFTASTVVTEGRFSTHSFSLMRFWAVWDLAPNPSMQFQPSHHADDMGATLGVPSSFRLLTSTT